MKEIFLTQGQVALVDDCDYERLKGFKWYAQKDYKTSKTYYARRMSPTINGKRHVIQMHCEILGIPLNGLIGDHKNGIGTDNQRHNLRFVTNRQNSQNRKNGKKKSSKYPGVCWATENKKWKADITISGITKHLGLFIDEKEAFETYCQAVEKLGEKMLEGAKNIK